MQTRIIKTALYKDEVILTETPDVRFIAVYLYTNSHIGLMDIYKIPVQLIQLETGFDISTIKLVLDKLQDKGIIKHHNHLWIRLLRDDFASLVYSGSTNEMAKEKYVDSIPEDILSYLRDTSIDTTHHTSMHTTYKSEIRNNKSKIINKKPEIIVNKLGEFNNVILDEEEINKLHSKIGEKNTNILIEELSGYMASTKKKYASHYATLLNWARRKIQDMSEKKNKSLAVFKD